MVLYLPRMPLLKFDTVQTGSVAKSVSPSTILVRTQYKIFNPRRVKKCPTISEKRFFLEDSQALNLCPSGQSNE